MARLTTVKPRVATLPSRLRTATTKEQRTTGRALQDIRQQHWLKDPHCAECGRYVGFPNGFELDHIIPLYQGGTDTDDNRQILCADQGDIEGCHSKKTKRDLK